MASLKYYLAQYNAKRSGIYFLFNYGAYEIRDGKKKYLSVKYYIDESIEPEYWNGGKAKSLKTFPQYPEFNARLKKIEDTALNIYRKMLNDGLEVNQTTLRAAFDREIKNKKDFTPGIDTHLVLFAEDYTKNTKKDENTKKQYRLTLKNLIEYEKKKNVKLKLLDINLAFYNDWVEFMQEEKSYAPNTLGCRIKDLKLWLNEAFKRNLRVCLDFKLPEFKKLVEEISSVYLTEEELMKLYRLELKERPYLKKTRDLFLIGAYTGFRYSDFSTLVKENFGKDGIIQKRTKKTDQNVVIPVHPVVTSILKNNGGEIPKVSYQIFNKNIKEIVKAAGITEPVSFTETRGGKSKPRTEPKWNLVGSHTARRSFATNAYLSGVPTISIMKMTGHKSEASFMKYIKITLPENAKILQHHSFFTKNI